MSGAGFFAGTMSPANTATSRGQLRPDRVLEHGAYGRLGRGGGDGEPPAGVGASAMTGATPGRPGSFPSATIAV